VNTLDIRRRIDAMVTSGEYGPNIMPFLLILSDLADHVAALESREEYRHRIKPIMDGEKPENGLGET
jgi:hypothetical protein